MILTPIAPETVPAALAAVRHRLEEYPTALAAFDRIAATWPVPEGAADTPQHRADAVALAHRFGIATLDEEPAAAFSWDGRLLRTRSEASVIVHEVAHWLLCAPERRPLPDFGLGAGPESGLIAEAEAARCMDDTAAQEEEVLTSLLGILWEVELGQPAILAFLEQNWLEGHARPACAEAFLTAIDALRVQGLLDLIGRPVGPGVMPFVSATPDPRHQPDRPI